MQLLVYYNVAYQSFSVHYEPTYFDRKIGDKYKANNYLISIIQVKPVRKPLRVVFKRFKHDFRYNLGNFLIKLGNRIKFKEVRVPKRNEQKQFPFWKY